MQTADLNHQKKKPKQNKTTVLLDKTSFPGQMSFCWFLFFLIVPLEWLLNIFKVYPVLGEPNELIL